jgi:hypothetical protein
MAKSHKPTSTPPYVARCLADVTPAAVSWLWTNRIALGKLNLIAGQPGLGKSQITALFAAVVSTGGIWPDGAAAPLGSVVFVCCEDDAADTIVPRLDAAGADRSRIHQLDWVIRPGEQREPQQSLFDLGRDIAVLRDLANDIGDVKLIVIDPISAYLGRLDSHKNSDMRSALAPLQKLAAEIGATIVLVSHLNKGAADGAATSRVSGSGAFVAACRSGWLVAKHQDEPRRIFTPLKNNIGNDREGFAFAIEGVDLPGGISTSRVVFESTPIEISADDALQTRSGDTDDAGAIGEAKAFLVDLLKDGPEAANSIFKKAKAAGISEITLRRAKSRLKVQTIKSQMSGGWNWCLPTEGDQPARRDDHDHLDRLRQNGHSQGSSSAFEHDQYAEDDHDPVHRENEQHHGFNGQLLDVLDSDGDIVEGRI